MDKYMFTYYAERGIIINNSDRTMREGNTTIENNYSGYYYKYQGYKYYKYEELSNGKNEGLSTKTDIGKGHTV